MLTLIDHAGLADPERAVLERTFGGFTMLHQVLDWGRAAEPRVAVDEIITMDEYTHDVLMPLREGQYLVFDTT